MGTIQLEEILQILREIVPTGIFEEKTLIFENGLVDSMTVFGCLLPKLEGQYGIQIEPPELIPENFETPEAILRYVKDKRKR